MSSEFEEKEAEVLRATQALNIATESMKRFSKTLIGYIIGRLLLVPVFSLIYGIPFYYLWNHIMLDFGFPHLSYLHACGFLVIVSWIFPNSYIPVTQYIDKSETPKWMDKFLHKRY